MDMPKLSGFSHNQKKGRYLKLRKHRGGNKGIITNQKGAFGRSKKGKRK